jgi:cold shock CspA family protein
MNNAFQKFFAGEGVPIPSSDSPEGDNSPVKPDDKRVEGKIIKVSDKGWGFISSKEIKFTRIFFHWTSLKQGTLKFTDLKNGMRVEFTPTEVQDKGFRAIKIVVLNDKPPTPVTNAPVTTPVNTGE